MGKGINYKSFSFDVGFDGATGYISGVNYELLDGITGEVPHQRIKSVNNKRTDNGLKFWTGTKAQYDVLVTQPTLYGWNVNGSSTNTYTLSETPQVNDYTYTSEGVQTANVITAVNGSYITLNDSVPACRKPSSDMGVDANTLYNITDDTDVTLTLLDALYPVGAIYIGTMATCPLQVIGVGTWQLVASDRVLQGAGTRGIVGATINESLPNITGRIAPWNAGLCGGVSGAIYTAGNWNAGRFLNHSGSNTSQGQQYFDASRSNSVYQEGAPVQQDAYLVNIWERTA
jgi:hypothetical protein